MTDCKEKFTRGPWHRAYNRSRGGSGKVRAQSKSRIVDNQGGIVAFAMPRPRQVANVQLIAAAPEMYECICDALTDLKMPDGMRAHFEEVLKKARGEE